MPDALNLTTAELAQTPMGQALMAGKLVATVIGSTGHVTIRANCKAKVNNRWQTVPFTEATHVFLAVPAADGGFADKVGTYYPQGKHEGLFWSDRSADACRIKAALYVLNAAAKRNSGTHVMQSTYCFRCGKELTEPESIKLGFGPTCYPHVQSQHAPKVKGGDGTGEGQPAEFSNVVDGFDLSDPVQRRAFELEQLRLAQEEGRDPRMGTVTQVEQYDRSQAEIERDTQTLNDARDENEIVAMLRKGDSAQLVLTGLEA
jgi:hypothetical protein